MTPKACAWAAVVAWALGHLVYPLWFPLSGDPAVAAGLYLAFGAALILGVRALKPALQGKAQDGLEPLLDLLSPPRDPWLWGLLAATVLIRLYPMTLPIHMWQGGDEGVHMGLPGLPFKVWARNLALPFPVVFWTLAVSAWLLRRRLRGYAGQAAKDVIRSRWPVLPVSAVAFAAYGIVVFSVVRRFMDEGHASLAADLLRFPPLSRLIRLPVYAAFGVSNFTGRLPELLFYAASGVIVYKVMEAYRSVWAARLAAVLFWLLPPFAYYAMRGSQTEGETFFFLLSLWFLARWAKNAEPASLYWGAFAAGLGSLHRYTVPVAAAVFAACVLWQRRSHPRLRKAAPPRILLEAGALLAAFILPWMTAYLVYGLRPYDPSASPLSLAGFLQPLAVIPSAVSWPGAAVLACGLYSAFTRKDALNAFLWAWFAGYYLFISRDAGHVLRLTIPLYAPLILWAADAGALWARTEGKALRLAGVLAAYFLSIGIWLKAPGLDPTMTVAHSLETEYLPLDSAAQHLSRIRPGTRVLCLDCSPGAFSLYLERPADLEWVIADPMDYPDLRALWDRCRQEGVKVVAYAGGAFEAFGQRRNDALFEAFAAENGWFIQRAAYKLGRNRVVFKDVLK